MLNHTVLSEQRHEEIVRQIKSPTSLSEMEQQIRQVMHWVGNKLVWVWLMWLSIPDNAVPQTCPHCWGQAKYKERRSGVLRTVFGEVHYRRGYYLCATCHQGHYPLDEQLGLRPNEMSAEVERLAAYVGVQMPFEQGSKLLAELAFIELSDHSLAKATRAYGQALVEQETAWDQVAQDETYVNTVQTPPCACTAP